LTTQPTTRSLDRSETADWDRILALSAGESEGVTAVLVIEDDQALAQLLRDVLEDEGYQAHHVESLAQAASILEAAPIDLILADLVEFDLLGGQQSILALKAVAGRRPIILCTGRDEAQQLAREAGIEQVLKKPFDFDRLMEQLKGALEEVSPDSKGS
jgi:two-component system, OmpR family, response regulator CpxR